MDDLMLIKNLDKGEYFKRTEYTKIVYVRDDYDRSEGKYWCYKFDDVNTGIYLAGDKQVIVNFEF